MSIQHLPELAAKAPGHGCLSETNMTQLVVMGALLKCPFGAAPGTLTVIPLNRFKAEKQWAANIMDHQPTVNIPSFGLCNSMNNPLVASATAAAMGVLTPMPCTPNTPTPWAPGAAKMKIAKMPALNGSSTCKCLWGGVIQITDPGTIKTRIA